MDDTPGLEGCSSPYKGTAHGIVQPDTQLYQVQIVLLGSVWIIPVSCTLTETISAGVGGGQSWDPFRPLRDLQPTLVSSEVLPASGRNVAYTRTSLSKLVLQKTASEVNTSKVQDERKESGFQHIRQPAPLAKSALPSQTPAARAVHISGATQGQTTQQSAAERRAHAAGQGAIGAAHLQPRLRKSGTAEAAVRHTRRTWQRQSKAGPSPAVGSLLQTPKRKGQTQEPTVIATHRHANTWQRTAQPPRFARRRGNQLVRLSSASPAYSSVLLRSGMASLPPLASLCVASVIDIAVARCQDPLDWLHLSMTILRWIRYAVRLLQAAGDPPCNCPSQGAPRQPCQRARMWQPHQEHRQWRACLQVLV